MHTKRFLIATLTLTASAIPIIHVPAPVSTIKDRRGLLDGLLGPHSLVGGLLGGLTGGGTGDAVSGVTGSLPIGGDLLSGLNLDGLLGGLLDLDGGLLGNLLGGLGIDASTGIIGGLLGGLLGGGKGKSTFIDPTKQKVPSGEVHPAKPQDGFTFTNILVASPKTSILDIVIQLLLGGKKSMFLTRTPVGSGLKTTSGQTFTVGPDSVSAVCFSNDISTADPESWMKVPCVMNVLGVKEGKLIGALAPQTIKFQKRSVSRNNRTVEEEMETMANEAPMTLEVDEIRLAFTPVMSKRSDTKKSPIVSVLLMFNIQLGA
ncbi:hypothetical protein TWF694_002838 [Orbilia ellipsospora]|uniref:Uncharacterized protein n=1 Tax=Orbilia ellipsospora TaxID=2528407 RepID=A0AAV9X138_9PEZI